MKLHFTIDVGLIETDAPFPSVTSEIQINFSDITNHEDWHIQETDSLRITLSPNTSQLDFYYAGGGGESVTQHFDEVSTNFQTIEFDGEITSGIENLDKFVFIGVVRYETINDETLVYLYTQNSENNALNKSLTLVNIIGGKFNHSIGVKALNIDVVNIDMNFNYAFIPTLNRYYFVDSIEIISNDVRRLHLKEDVLSSWNLLIRKQSAFILRREKGSNKSVLFDERLPLEDKGKVIDITSQIVDTPSSQSLVNIEFDYTNPTQSSSHSNILLSTFCKDGYSSGVGANSYNVPSVIGLPSLSSTHNNKQFFSFITPSKFAQFMVGYISDDTTASFVLSALWLPFNPQNAFQLESQSYIRVGEKYVNTLGGFSPNTATDTPMASLRGSQSLGLNGLCPYLVFKDFTFSNATSMLDYEPNSNYEFYIPFVGWVKVELNKFLNDRILIYYTMDLVTGLSTAYIYNYSQKNIIWSGSCQLGFKIDLSTTNQLENIRQKQANETNMILSLLTSALSIGVGVVTKNPVAITGGVLSGGKAVSTFVNNNNQIFERAQTTFGSTDGAMHCVSVFKLRKTYHETIFIDNSVYGHMQGYPSNEYVADFEDVYGYVEIGEIHFNPFNEVIYQDEITEIVALLKDGVIF